MRAYTELTLVLVITKMNMGRRCAAYPQCGKRQQADKQQVPHVEIADMSAT